MRPTQEEKVCMRYALRCRKNLNFIDKLKFKYFSNNQTSENKSFQQLWSDDGLRDYGNEYWHRGLFTKDQKIDCIQKWVNTLYSTEINVHELFAGINKELLDQLDSYMKKNPGVRVSMQKAENIIPEKIDTLYGNYKS
jgi:hypothetical protein